MASPPPSGVYAPIVTFFVPKSASYYSVNVPPLDLETQAKHSIHLAKCGLRGLVVLGSTGEAVAIDNAERITLLKHIRQELEKAGYHDYPLIAGTATQSIEDTLIQLRDAKDCGYQWGLVLAPGYFAPAVTQEGLIAWYTAIADRSPIPIMIYHYPAVSNNIAIRPSTFATLSSHRNIVGCKLSHNDISAHAQIASSPSIDHKYFAVFTGLGQQLLPVLAVGCAGTIDGLANIFPRVVVRLYEAAKEGDYESARRIQEIVCRGEELVVGCGVVGIKEGVSRVLGMGNPDGTRLPMKGGLPDGGWAKFEGVVAELEKLEKDSS